MTFDDNEYFSNYHETTHLTWKSIWDFFSHYYVIMYQPLPVMSFAVNYHFTGLDTFPLHLVNLCFHVANVILVFQFIKLLTSNINIAIIVSLLFGIHPMNVEAVSWISARSSSMYTFFYLFALIYYLKYLKQDFKSKNLIITAIFFLLSLFSKAQAVTLPVMLLLIDFYFERNLLSRKVVREKILFFILSLVFGIVTLLNKGTITNLTEGMIIAYTPVDIFFITCYSFLFYFFKLILPINLCSVYVYPPKTGELLPWEYYFSAVALLLILVLIFKIRKNKQVFFAIALFFITISINIQIIPSRLFVVAERYAYFPYVGLYLVPLFLIFQLKEKRNLIYKKCLPFFIAVLIIYSAFSSYAVINRNLVWKNDETLMSDIIAKNPPVMYLANAHGIRGLYFKKLKRNPEAIADLSESIRLKPDEYKNYYNRALTFVDLNNKQAALQDFSKAIALKPDQASLYSLRSQLKFIMKDINGAVADSKKCIQLDSANYDAYNTLATIDFTNKNYVQCEANLNLAIKYKQDFDVAFKNRGWLFLQLEKREQACKDLIQAANLGNKEAMQLLQQYCK